MRHASAGFKSFAMAGFECASHRPPHGVRLDLTAATRHDELALRDYRRARAHGFHTVRDGIRWHLVEITAGRYDFSSVLPMLRAARLAGVQVIWDLCHFGWPDDLDIFSAPFADRLAGLARAFTRLCCDEGDELCYIAPINEPSYLAWAAGEVGYIHPYVRGRGDELKRQLLGAYAAAVDAILSVQPAARIVATDPLIRVLPHPAHPQRAARAREIEQAQYDFRDRLAEAGCLDIVGACYYECNQWYERGEVLKNVPLEASDPNHRPLSQMLAGLHRRYGRPLFLAETSAEQNRRAGWARWILREVAAALAQGTPIEGVCWYPAIDHLGWDDDRPCRHGLWGEADASGARRPYTPLLAAFKARASAECAAAPWRPESRPSAAPTLR